MPIYRVPELSSKPNFDNDHPPQDIRHHHHHHRRRQQQHHHHQGSVTETRRSSSPGLQLLPDEGDESIVEREIRLQLEKEAEIATLHRALERTFSIDSDELETTETKAGSGSEAEAEEEVGRRRSSVATDDERHVIGQYSRAGESLIAREMMEQKRREKELRNRHRKIDGGGEEGNVRNPSGKPDYSGRSFQGQLSFEEDLDFDGRSGAGPTGVPRDRRRSDFEEAEENLRRMATDRLRQELLTERQREIELRRRGRTSTTSVEDRVGFDQSRSTKRKSARGAASSSSSFEDTRRSHRVQTDAPSGLPGGEGAGGGGGGGQTEKRRTSMELRIEEEVREARKREKELREQRRLLNTAILTSP